MFLTLVKKIKKYLLRFKHHNIYEMTSQRSGKTTMKVSKNYLRSIIHEVVSWPSGEELVRTRDTGPAGVNTDFGAEPLKSASFDAWKFRLETDVLGDDVIPVDERMLRGLYKDWRTDLISWDEVVDHILDLAY